MVSRDQRVSQRYIMITKEHVGCIIQPVLKVNIAVAYVGELANINDEGIFTLIPFDQTKDPKLSEEVIGPCVRYPMLLDVKEILAVVLLKKVK
jgi:hypothetical protein